MRWTASWRVQTETTIITAIILINTAQGRTAEVAEALIELTGIVEAYSVSGPYDLAVIAKVKQHEDLSELIAGRMQKVPGIGSTITLVAFQVYNRRSLEAFWDIGNEESQT